MVVQSANKKTHLVMLKDGKPIVDGLGGLKSQCGVWVQIEQVHHHDEVELTCKNCKRIQNNRNEGC